MISFRYCTQLYANVKALQVRLQHSPDLEVNAKIVSLLPFQLLLYMIVFKYCSLCYLMLIFCSSRKCPYPSSTEGTFAEDPLPDRISIPWGACHTPNPLEFLLLLNLVGYPL